MKYNLTFGQKLLLPIFYFYWLQEDSEKRKTWHEVKKGLEKHICDFSIPTDSCKGYEFLKCSHEGCNFVKFKDELK
jgi:hypothetical protein